MSAGLGDVHEPDGRLTGLLVDAQAGISGTLGELLQSYRDYLYLLADDELGSDLKPKVSASDLVQESFLEAHRDFRQFTGDSVDEFKAWLRQLLLHNIGDVIRSFRQTEMRDISKERMSGTRKALRSQPLRSNDTSASSVVVQQELLDALSLAISALPGHYQQVIQWRNYERLSFDNIGKRLGRTTEAARKLWVRAVEMLEQELNSSHDATLPQSRAEIY